MPSYEATEARRLAFEPVFAARIRAELIRQGEVAAAAYEAGSSPEVAAALVKMDGLTKELNNLYTVVGVAFAKAQYDELTSTKSMQTKKLPGAELVASWVGRLRRFFSGEGTTRVRGMQQTTGDIIKDTLNQARLDGLSIPEAANLLRQKVATLSQARATLIARTEIVSASNLASKMGAESTGLALNMRWIATPGGRTRDTHRAANGQVAPLSGTFTVGGFPARYPGDPLLPAKEIVNCRCAIGYIPV